MKSERGASLIETVIALALLGIISAAFLSALATSSNARNIADVQVSARILAETQMEELKKQTYAFSYNATPIPDEYPGYTALIEADSLRNGNIQMITVTIEHYGKEITHLESYKVNR
ncbi:MAG: type II secretion system protein [Dehalococcoidales bacterium]